jgi:hypothetical protein
MEKKEEQLSQPTKVGVVKEEDYFSVDQEILGGLKSAVERGETLKQAMMTFYRAGYKKQDIEHAARIYLETDPNEISKPLQKDPEIRKEEPKKEGTLKEGSASSQDEKETKKFKPLVAGKRDNAKPKVIQKVSAYKGKKPTEPGSKFMTFILIIILLFLLGILASVFLFKSELVDAFNSLFG